MANSKINTKPFYPRLLEFKGDGINTDRLDRFLQIKFSNYLKTEFSITQAKKLLDSSHVFLNGNLVRVCSKPVFKKSKVQILAPFTVSAPDQNPTVVYEDQDVIILDKPAGLPTQSTLIKMQANLYDWVIGYITAKQPQSLGYAGLIHRLDKDTSGLVLFTKSKRMNKPITEQFKNSQIEKTYVARVFNPDVPPAHWECDSSLLRKKTPRGYKTIVNQQGQLAKTAFELLEDLGNEQFLLKAFPKTGRTHQIRAHLAHSLAPIVGDRLYGSEIKDTLFLHAQNLSFFHPFLNKKMSFQSPTPERFWTK